MIKPIKILERLSSGNFKNIKFSNLQKLLEGLGFRLERVKGSHHIYFHPEIPDIVNIQNVKREAKPYQIRQVLQLIEKHGLILEK